MFKKKGFTLIEMLVVILIIMTLASVVIISLSTARKTGRDAKRIADLTMVAAGLQLYYADNHTYPVSDFDGIAGTSSSFLVSGKYLESPITADPYQTGAYAYYCPSPGTLYNLWFVPEDSKNYTYANRYEIQNGQVCTSCAN